MTNPIRMKVLVEPTNPWRRRGYWAAKKLHHIGRTWPVPVFRPLMRKVGARLYLHCVDEVVREVRIGDWSSHAIWEKLDLNGPPLRLARWERLRMRYEDFRAWFEESPLYGPWRHWIW